ncbi:MAG: hypothetical protein R3B09_24205 [Nannocystaceae bacterium]
MSDASDPREWRLIYDVVCPRCGARAWAEMIPRGIAGTYREATARLAARRIGCERCGAFQEVPIDKGFQYTLWFRGIFGGRPLWARNEGHLDLLIEWLEGDMNPHRLSLGERTTLECLPQWMLRRRREVALRLRAMKRRG